MEQSTRIDVEAPVGRVWEVLREVERWPLQPHPVDLGAEGRAGRGGLAQVPDGLGVQP